MMRRFKRQVGRRVLYLLLLTACVFMVPVASADRGQDDPQPATAIAAASTAAQANSTAYLPLVVGPPKNSWRLGYGAYNPTITRYPEISSLRAGWYVDWTTRAVTLRPNYIEYAQTVRIHQTLKQSAVWDCTLYGKDAHDRIKCPYATPPGYMLFQRWADIAAAVRANPGSLWLIGNEMDRRDWPGGGQDEMIPSVYSRAYHDLYRDIKAIDPTARVAIGGMIQATPLRLEYLTKVWDEYRAFYGTDMPVDVWNVHNFILQEKLGDYGAETPPGISATQGVIYPDEPLSHINRTYFATQIREFRKWMKAHNQQDKPLIVSEYGVLYYHLPELNVPATVQDFMLWTFDYFLNTRDCDLGYRADDCRLVQRWAWYSLDDPGTGFNSLSSLFDHNSRQITSTGQRFREYSLSRMDALGQYPYWW